MGLEGRQRQQTMMTLEIWQGIPCQISKVINVWVDAQNGSKLPTSTTKKIYQVNRSNKRNNDNI